jgi:hypothetical protein
MEEKDKYQSNQQQSGQQPTAQTTQQGQQQTTVQPDMAQLVTVLTQVFSTMLRQIQNQPPRSLEGDAKRAVEVSNDIANRLRFKSPPRNPVLKATVILPTKIKLEWEDDINADGFKLRRCQGPNCQDLADIVEFSASTREYLDENLSSNIIYRYKLTAFNSQGEASSNIIEAETSKA